MSADPFKPLRGNEASTKRTSSPSWEAVVPVPNDAPSPPAKHPKRGAPSATWEYRGAEGELLGFVCRFDETDGGKAVLPLSYCRRDKALEWRWRALSAPRALYGLDRLAKQTSDPVIVTEGEKAADAVRELLPGFIAVTSSGGSKAAGKADWSPLNGRQAIIWPDADEPGRAYANAVAKHTREAGAASIELLEPPTGVAEGWDAADALADGWDETRATSFIETASQAMSDTPEDAKRTPLDTGASEPQNSEDANGRGSGCKRTPQRDILLSQLDGSEFWHDASGDAYATFPTNKHHEHRLIRSREFKRWLAHTFFKSKGTIIGGQALEDVLRVLEARAVHEGKEYQIWRRVGRQCETIYLDLGDPKWRAIEIDAEGWRVVATPPVKLLRSSSMRALPEPEAGYLVEELRSFVPVAAEEDFRLIVAWLVAALRGRGPHPILVINGEQGSGKSGVSRMLRLLIDPDVAPIRSVPRDDRDLIVSADNGYVLAYDNLSGLSNWLSDGLCRIATGSGFATRRLHTDREEEVFSAARPIILNGIPDLTARPDLADRSITIHLPTIPEDQRRPEDELEAEYQVAAPHILGALLDAVSAAIRYLPETRLEKLPRMADFAKWVVAAEQGLGWDRGSFLAAYEDNRQDTFDSALEADMVAVAIRDLVTADHPEGWEGKPGELLGALNSRVPENTKKSRSWPGSASALGSRLRRSAPLLRRAGFAVEYGHSGDRFIRIVPLKS